METIMSQARVLYKRRNYMIVKIPGRFFEYILIDTNFDACIDLYSAKDAYLLLDSIIRRNRYEEWPGGKPKPSNLRHYFGSFFVSRWGDEYVLYDGAQNERIIRRFSTCVSAFAKAREMPLH